MATTKAKAKSEILANIRLSYTVARKIGAAIGSLITVLIVVTKAALLPTFSGATYNVVLALIIGGLIFSAFTVQAFAYSTMPQEKLRKFSNGWIVPQNRTLKSWGLVVLLEGLAVCLPVHSLQGGRFVIALGIVSVCGIVLASINGYCASVAAVNSFVSPTERKRWEAIRATQAANRAEIAELKQKQAHTKALAKLEAIA